LALAHHGKAKVMQKLRVISVFGTRPEAIKMAPVLHALRQDAAFEVIISVTAQHREMLDQVLQLFSITPEYDLNIMAPGQTLHDVTARVVTGIGEVLKKTQPDIVLVQGDTTTCFGAALAAFYHRIPVGHLEAGLRTGNIYSPFPEEVNRVLTSHLATFHFAATQQAQQNLLEEGIAGDHIWVTGNTVVDALHMIKRRVDTKLTHSLEGLPNNLRTSLVGTATPLILITGHRRESFGQGFANICKAIKQLAKSHPDWQFVYPVHLNPNVQGPVYATLQGLANVALLDPLPYLPFVELMNRATLILTDSGGIQEEALSLGKPLLVMRETTERTEAVDAGYAKLVGTETSRLVEEVNHVMSDPDLYRRMSCVNNPYGDGNAAGKIRDILKTHLIHVQT
jgi:UDP-N-acetylglucosamine 2-epimerase (non-hydrolysing)